MAVLAELTDTIGVAADAIGTNFEIQQQQTFRQGSPDNAAGADDQCSMIHPSLLVSFVARGYFGLHFSFRIVFLN